MLTKGMEGEVVSTYGNKVRVRACGLCWHGDSLLLANHQYLGVPNFWAPPGGGVEFGHSAEETVAREFAEETGFVVRVNSFLFAAEFIQNPLHAIELYFDVTILSGSMRVGTDPETNARVLKEVTYKTWPEVRQLPAAQRHGIFGFASTPSDLRNLRGYIRLL
jgi:8-oxo-dGTP diphosphatase